MRSRRRGANTLPRRRCLRAVLLLFEARQQNPRPVHVPYTSRTRRVHVPYSPLHISHVPYTSPTRPLHVYYTSTTRLLHVPYTSPTRPLHVPYMPPTCPLHAPYTAVPAEGKAVALQRCAAQYGHDIILIRSSTSVSPMATTNRSSPETLRIDTAPEPYQRGSTATHAVVTTWTSVLRGNLALCVCVHVFPSLVQSDPVCVVECSL
jgi:hypothetical protein